MIFAAGGENSDLRNDKVRPSHQVHLCNRIAVYIGSRRFQLR